MEQDISRKLDKYDVGLAVSSGVLTAAMDVLWIGDLSFEDAHVWGQEKTDELVISFERANRFKGKELDDAIRFLEKKYPMDGDKLTNKFGGGYYHHLRDFSHHPTFAGAS